MVQTHFETTGGGHTAVSTSNPLPVQNYGVSGTEDAAGHDLTARGYATKTVTILGGASLSDEVDLEGYGLVAISVGANLDGASITFQAATASGGTFYDVYDGAGNVLSVVASDSRVISDISEISPLRFIKLRAGTPAAPAPQQNTTTVTLILKG